MERTVDWKKEIMILLDRIEDDKVLRRIWKILISALNRH